MKSNAILQSLFAPAKSLTGKLSKTSSILTFCFLALFFSADLSHAQQQWTGPIDPNNPISRNGNVGIGVAIPLSRLHVGAGGLLLDNAQPISWVDQNGQVQPVMRFNQFGGVTLWNTLGNDIAFGTGAETGANTRMVIKGFGNVGIGPAAIGLPEAQLHVDGDILLSNNRALFFKDQDGDNRPVLRFNQFGSVTLWNTKGDDIAIGTGVEDINNARLVIKQFGNVGIGVTAPETKLHVDGDILLSNNRAIMFEDLAGNNGHVLSLNQTGPLHLFNPLAEDIQIGTGGINSNNIRMVIKHFGEVGIGTTTPLEKLDVAGGIRLGNSNGTNAGAIRWTGADFEGYDGTAWQSFTQGGGNGNSPWTLNNNNIFYNNGNVGIGTDAPKSALEIFGDLAIGDNAHRRAKIRLMQEAQTADDSASYAIGTEADHITYGPGPLYPNTTGHKFYTHGNLVAAQIGMGASGFNAATALNSYFNGNVGIRTQNPEADLHVNGTLLMDGQVRFKFNDSTNAVVMQLFNDDVEMWNTTGNDINFGTGLRLANNVKMTIKHDGNVGIGTQNPTHKLAVNGTVRAKEIIVDNTNWADFVFADDYQLRSLEEVESFVKTNRHLPEMPSEADVEANGVSLGEMQSKLLQKIEELTLYVIDLKKENTALAERLADVEKK